MKNTDRLQRCRGSSTLEFVVVLPLLMMILFAGVELSRAWMTFNVVVAAAREGARVGVVTEPFSPAPAIARIDTVLAAAKLPTSSSGAVASVTCAAPCGPDSPVTASVTVNFHTHFPKLLPFLPGTIPLTETTVMRFE